MKGKYEQIKLKNYVLTHVQPMLTSKASAKKLEGSEIPYEEYLDLLLSCYISVRPSETIPVTGEILTKANLTWKEIVSAATENIEQFCTIDYLDNILARILGTTLNSIPNKMMVASNRQMQYGSAVITNPKVLKDLAEILGDEYILLPSSVHEVICVPGKDVPDLMSMVDLVKSINDTELQEEDRLSDNAYQYHNGKLIAAV